MDGAQFEILCSSTSSRTPQRRSKVSEIEREDWRKEGWEAEGRPFRNSRPIGDEATRPRPTQARRITYAGHSRKFPELFVTVFKAGAS